MYVAQVWNFFEVANKLRGIFPSLYLKFILQSGQNLAKWMLDILSTFIPLSWIYYELKRVDWQIVPIIYFFLAQSIIHNSTGGHFRF